MECQLVATFDHYPPTPFPPLPYHFLTRGLLTFADGTCGRPRQEGKWAGSQLIQRCKASDAVRQAEVSFQTSPLLLESCLLINILFRFFLGGSGYCQSCRQALKTGYFK